MTKHYNHLINWNHHYVGAKHAFDTTRKSQEIVNTIGAENVHDPMTSNFYAEQVEKAIVDTTSQEYVDALKQGEPLYLAESNGFEWDYGIWQMALNSTAGVINAASYAANTTQIAGSLSSGLHHANQKRGGGFCTVNGLAVAANWMKDTHITILDFDAHCGGGTVQNLRHLGIDNRVEQYDISTNRFDEYDQDETHNITIATNDAQYLRAVDQILDEISPNTEVILYNAGVDPYPTISHDTLAERDRTVFQWAAENNKGIAYVLAGGYTFSQTMDQLVQSHINTLDAAEAVHQQHHTLNTI